MGDIIRLKTSRVSFISNYILGALILMFLILLSMILSISELWILLITAIIFIFIFEPEGIILHKTYLIDSENLTEIKGILTKKITSIPLEKISGQTINKGIVGRIFNYGSIEIMGFDSRINMNGIKNPDKVHKIITNKIAQFKK